MPKNTFTCQKGLNVKVEAPNWFTRDDYTVHHFWFPVPVLILPGFVYRYMKYLSIQHDTKIS